MYDVHIKGVRCSLYIGSEEAHGASEGIYRHRGQYRLGV